MKVNWKHAKPFCLFSCLILLSCGTVASVKPVGAGNRSLSFSAGGPVAPVYDIEMPLPYSVLRYRFGIDDETDVHIGLHPTMALFGNLGTDAGLTRHLVRNQGLRPGISASVSLYGFCHLWEARSARLYPELAVIATYDVARRLQVFYLGVETMFQFTEPYFIPVLLVGTEFSLSRRSALDLEAKWYAPTQSGNDRVVDYTITPFKQGALGFAFGVAYDLGGR
jgi:hypothetical protein